MIRQSFDIKGYWRVVVYYNVDYSLFNRLERELTGFGAAPEVVNDIYRHMSSGMAKAVTYSNYSRHMSIVIFNRHGTMADYINSIVHEAEHIKQAMLAAYGVEDAGEPPAYTIGFIVMKMYRMLRYFIGRCI